MFQWFLLQKKNYNDYFHVPQSKKAKSNFNDESSSRYQAVRLNFC